MKFKSSRSASPVAGLSDGEAVQNSQESHQVLPARCDIESQALSCAPLDLPASQRNPDDELVTSEEAELYRVLFQELQVDATSDHLGPSEGRSMFERSGLPVPEL